MFAMTISGEGNISLVGNGKQYYVKKDNKNYDQILDLIRNHASVDEILDLISDANKVSNYFQSYRSPNLVVEGGRVFYIDTVNDEKEEVHGTVVERILSFMEQNLPVHPLVNFLTKRFQNPSYVSGEELFDFLDHKSLPICEDGDFLAYKAVSPDYFDKYSRKFDNSVGSVVEVRRRKVDDNRNNGCSYGLHVGTLDYVNGYGHFICDDDGNPTLESDRCIIVKVNPADVVSVPTDCTCQKLRCCRYSVLSDFSGELDYHLATNEGVEWDDSEDIEFDDDYDFYNGEYL